MNCRARSISCLQVPPSIGQIGAPGAEEAEGAAGREAGPGARGHKGGSKLEKLVPAKINMMDLLRSSGSFYKDKVLSCSHYACRCLRRTDLRAGNQRYVPKDTPRVPGLLASTRWSTSVRRLSRDTARGTLRSVLVEALKQYPVRFLFHLFGWTVMLFFLSLFNQEMGNRFADGHMCHFMGGSSHGNTFGVAKGSRAPSCPMPRARSPQLWSPQLRATRLG